MGPVARLFFFAFALLLLFGGAALAGSVVGPDRGGAGTPRAHSGTNASHGRDGPVEESTGAHSSPAAERTEADAVRGLAVSDDGQTLVLQPTELARGRATELRFSILAADRYRLYLQFKHEGRVRTAEFTQEVTR